MSTIQTPKVSHPPSPSPSPSTGSTPVTGNATKLHPKEHGAYAILAIPIVTAMIVAGPTVVGFCVAIASVSGFLAHEPLLVAWGHRGQRAKSSTPGANSRLIAYLAIACCAGSVAMLLGASHVRLSLLACLIIAMIGFALALAGKHRTTAGQIWGVIGLSVPSVPILLAGSVETAPAITIWITWLLGFMATTFAVHSVIAAQKRRPRAVHATILSVVTLAVVVGASQEISPIAAIVPMVLVSWVLFFRPPPARYLKRVGWTLVTATVLTALIIIAN